MKNFNGDGFYKLAKIFAIILVSISIAYYLVVFLPGKEKYKRSVEENKMVDQEVIKKESDLEQKNTACLNNADRIRKDIEEHNKQYATSLGIKVMGDLFYSPHTDSCIYFTREIIPNNGVQIVIKDAATDKLIEASKNGDYDSLIEKYKTSN